jgi:peptidoglycan/LPS O-acetylase OafA/YrhL
MTSAAQVENLGRTGQESGYNKLPGLTGLRVIAALIVFLSHARALPLFGNHTVQAGYAHIFENGATFAMSCFVVLSGFVLTWSTKIGETARRFYRRRVFKMFPNHVVVYVAIAALLIAGGATLSVGPAVANLFLVQAWIPDLSLGTLFKAVNGQTAALSAELFLCLAFPFLVLLVRRIRPERLWAWAVGLSLLTLTLPPIVQSLAPRQPVNPYVTGVSLPDMWFLCFGPTAWVTTFLVGMILARIVREGRWIGVGVLPVVLLVIGVYALASVVPTAYGMTALYPLPVSLLFAAVAVSDLKGRRIWLASKPMVWLGECTYAFFLIHLTLLYVAFNVFTDQPLVAQGGLGAVLSWGPFGGLGFLAGVILVCLLLSRMLYRLVELPMMRRGARRNTGQQVKAAPTAVDRSPITDIVPQSAPEEGAA